MKKQNTEMPNKAEMPNSAGKAELPSAGAWSEASRVAELPSVAEALQGFSEDSTGDNGVCVVRAVLESQVTASNPLEQDLRAAIAPNGKLHPKLVWRIGDVLALNGWAGPRTLNELSIGLAQVFLEHHEDPAVSGTPAQADDNVVDAEYPPASPQALQLAAQAWQEPGTNRLVMDPRLAEAFGRILDRYQAAVLESAERWVMARRDAFIEQHGSADPETGTLEFGRGTSAELKREYVGELDEIADGILGLAHAEEHFSFLMRDTAAPAPLELRIFPNDGSQPEDTGHLDCNACGGSGHADDASAAVRSVLAERQRQKDIEGWSPEHDDKYINCDLARAAATYALCTRAHELKVCDVVAWPWPIHWWKPSAYRRNLEKAGALIIAEIERIDRAATKGGAA